MVFADLIYCSQEVDFLKGWLIQFYQIDWKHNFNSDNFNQISSNNTIMLEIGLAIDYFLELSEI